MSESVVADFVANANSDGSDGPDGERSRVLLSEDRLVVATDDDRTVVDLDEVVDVLVSRVPRDLGDFVDQTVLVAYTEAERRRTVVVTGPHETIDRFARYLYKATLRGSGATVKHPARRGGRIVDAPRRTARVAPESDSLALRCEEGACHVELASVESVTKCTRSVDGRSRPVLSVCHGDATRTLATEIAHESVQTLNVLARFLRLELFRLESDLADVAIDETEAEALAVIYAGGDPGALERVLDTDADAVEALLAGLEQKGLVVDAGDPTLTNRGRVSVAQRIDRVDT